jgi:uncharacterized protein YndB with AHSA1/START domain
MIEVVIAAPVDTVWRALRDPAEIRRWFGWEYEGLDEEIRYIFVEHSQADDEAHVLDGGEGGTIALEPQGEQTVVRVTRPTVSEGYDEIDEGWITFLQQLRFYLERHSGQERRTEHIGLSGDEWFSSEHQHAVIREDGALVIRTRERVIVSSYGT